MDRKPSSRRLLMNPSRSLLFWTIEPRRTSCKLPLFCIFIMAQLCFLRPGIHPSNTPQTTRSVDVNDKGGEPYLPTTPHCNLRPGVSDSAGLWRVAEKVNGGCVSSADFCFINRAPLVDGLMLASLPPQGSCNLLHFKTRACWNRKRGFNHRHLRCAMEEEEHKWVVNDDKMGSRSLTSAFRHLA